MNRIQTHRKYLYSRLEKEKINKMQQCGDIESWAFFIMWVLALIAVIGICLYITI